MTWRRSGRRHLQLGNAVLCLVLVLVAASSVRAQESSPEPDRPTLAGPVAGALTALAPLVAGGLLLADDARPDRQRQGLYLVTAGFAAAPWVAHGVSGRWKRAAAFGLVSLAASAATVAAMAIEDPYDTSIPNRHRLPFGILFTTAFVAAAAGVIDSFLWSPPGKERP